MSLSIGLIILLDRLVSFTVGVAGGECSVSVSEVGNGVEVGSLNSIIFFWFRDVNPHLIFQRLSDLLFLCLTVENVSSHFTWNCGDTSPVVVSRIRVIVDAWCSE